ncbi:MAG: hypothetical protein AABX85_04900 [Nanoarchaeota archaeon]
MAEINEQEREEIRIEAKRIIDNFASALEKVKIKEKKGKKEISGFREEGNGKKGDSEFRKKMFANAANKNQDNIIAETKSW